MKNFLLQKGLVIIFALLFCNFLILIPAQTLANPSLIHKFEPLQIGDTIPDEIWDWPFATVNSSIPVKTLQMDRDKLIIIAFWASSCSSSALSVAETLRFQKVFNCKLVIVPVSKESTLSLNEYFRKSNVEKVKEMPTISNDRVLHELFPHFGVPFLVWIKDGKLLNTTDIGQLSENTVNEILISSPSSLQTVVQLNSDKPIFLSTDFYSYHQNVNLQHYSILLKGIVKGLGGGGTLRENDKGIINGRLFSNQTLGSIYFSLGFDVFRQRKETLFNEKRMIFKMENTQGLMPDSSSPLFYNDNLYSYDITVPENEQDKLTDYIIQDLNRYTDYNIQFENRLTDCLVLVRISNKDKIKSKAGKKIINFYQKPAVIQNAKLATLINLLNSEKNISYPIIDESGYTDNVDLKISSTSDILALNEDLQQYDLNLVKVKRNLLMMVIRKK
ncbi:MAG: hypothetical protein LC112_06525 [Flavobacteriales bacterium]|nr:hypothetical protein [Flavobacteriales bacterium]